MSIAHLYDHTCVIWRHTEGQGTRGETVRLFPDYQGPMGCKSNRQNTGLMLEGPGVTPAGRRVVYIDPGPSVKERDLVELVTGPDAPALLEVENVTTPRSHHLEIRGVEWPGQWPELGS